MKTITKLILSSSTLFAEENLIQNGSFEDFTILKDAEKWKKVNLIKGNIDPDLDVNETQTRVSKSHPI
jgi:hypothetical protein